MNKNAQFTQNELFQKIEAYFKKDQPEKAEELYHENLKILPGVTFYRLRKNYNRDKESEKRRQSRLKQEKRQREERVRQKIYRLLSRYDFDSADSYYNKNKPYYPETAYNSLRSKYKKDQLVSNLQTILPLELNESDRVLIAESITHKKESLPEKELSQEDALILISHHLDTKKISFEGAKNLICLFAVYSTNNRYLNQEIVLIKKILTAINTPYNRIDEIHELKHQDLVDSNTATAIWKILSNNPSAFGCIIANLKNSLNRISGYFPWHKLKEISSFYLPPEKEFLKLIINNSSFSQSTAFSDVIQRHNFLNCKTIYNLLWLKEKWLSMNPKPSKDFLWENIISFLTRLIKDDFEYNRANQTKTENLIFPSCNSHASNRAPSLSAMPRSYIFCEGNWVDKGNGYIMCRNHRCDEKGLNLRKQTTTFNGYFVSFLEDNFGIPVDMLYRSKDFMKCMGALTRGNELTEILYCGCNENNGCGSTLTYSQHYGKDGFIAYTTSYWKCSNPLCNKQNQIIKISHCAGCNKIIDSRVDHQKCPGNYKNPIYICKSCGYCCQAHIISGICPSCGKTPNWIPDKYASRYTCSNCNHTIKIPVIYKKQAQVQLSQMVRY